MPPSGTGVSFFWGSSFLFDNDCTHVSISVNVAAEDGNRENIAVTVTENLIAWAGYLP